MDSRQENWRWRALGCTALSHLVNDGWTAMIPVIADIINSQRHVSIIVVTLMSVGFYSTSALLSFSVGRWVDKSGALGRTLAIGITIITLCFLGFYLALQFSTGTLLLTLAVVISTIAGFGSAFYHPLAGTILRTVFPPRDRGKVLGFNGAFGSLGSAIFPASFLLAAVFLMEPNALLLLTCLCLVAAAVVWRGIASYRLPPGDITGAGAKIRSTVTDSIIILATISGVRAISNTGMYFWLPTYLTQVKGEGIGPLLGLTLATVFIGAIPGQIAYGILIEKFDKRYMLGLSSGGSALSMLGFLYASGYEELILVGLFGFFTFSSFPTLLSITSDYAPSASSSAAIAFVWGLGATGGNVFGPAIIGSIIGGEYSRLNYAFLIMIVVGLIGAAVTPLMPRPTRREVHEQVA